MLAVQRETRRGFCECGCGQRTRPAPRTDSGCGWIKGEPLRFVRYHHVRKPTLLAEVVGDTVKIPLAGEHGAAKHALVDQSDYERLMAFRWQLGAGGYVVYAPSSSRKIYLHVLVLGERPGYEVDHVNGNKLDCRRRNLRHATRRQNCMNTRKSPGKSSRFKGVSYIKARGTWCAYIKNGDRHEYLGYFHDEEEAAMAYDVAAVRVFGEFARLNFPDRLTPEGRE